MKEFSGEIKKICGNFGYEKSFHSFAPVMATDPQTKIRIREKANELFMRYGIRSVSMDDIAAQLGMSKKTIYQYFMDKDELVNAVVDEELTHMEADCMVNSQEAENAIHEIFLALDTVIIKLGHINPMVVYDMEKFHLRAFQRLREHKMSFLYQCISKNIEWGQKDGLYRTNLNIDILTLYRLESMMLPFNIAVYPPGKFNLAEVCKQILEHFVFGLASEKGYQLILQYQQERNKNVKSYDTLSGKDS